MRTSPVEGGKGWDGGKEEALEVPTPLEMLFWWSNLPKKSLMWRNMCNPSMQYRRVLLQIHEGVWIKGLHRQWRCHPCGETAWISGYVEEHVSTEHAGRQDSPGMQGWGRWWASHRQCKCYEWECNGACNGCGWWICHSHGRCYLVVKDNTGRYWKGIVMGCYGLQ